MSLDQEQLRQGLRRLADSAPDTDVRAGVRHVLRRRRRRRVTGTVLVALGGLVLSAGLVGNHGQQASPASPHPGGARIDLASLPTGTLPRARLVVAVSGGPTYAVGGDGKAVRLPVADGAGPQGDWTLLPDGSALAGLMGGGTTTPIAVVQRTDGNRTLVPLPPDRTIDAVALAPDQSRLAVLAGTLVDGPGTIRLVLVPDGQVQASGAFAGAMVQAVWSADASTLAFVRSASPLRAVDTGALRFSPPAAAVIPAVRSGPVHLDASVSRGWVVSPDGSRLLIGVRASPGTAEAWYQLASATAGMRSTITRPRGDTPLAWTSDGHLVWWRLPVGGDRAEVLESSLDGTGDKILYEVTLPRDRVVTAWYASS